MKLALARKPASKEIAIAKSFFEGNPNGLVRFLPDDFQFDEFVYVP